MKLIRKDFCVWNNDIYIIPTFRIFIDNQIYINHNFSIEFHWLVFHARLLFEQAESERCDEKECPNYVPKKYGKWIDRKNVVCLENVRWKYECSECGHEVRSKYNFCPNCGAKMQEDKE